MAAGAGYAAIAEIGPITLAGMECPKAFGGLASARRKTLAPPDLIKPAAVATIAIEQVFLPDSQPTRDPDVDGIGFGQRAYDRPDGLAGAFRLALVGHACLTLDLNWLFCTKNSCRNTYSENAANQGHALAKLQSDLGRTATRTSV